MRILGLAAAMTLAWTAAAHSQAAQFAVALASPESAVFVDVQTLTVSGSDVSATTLWVYAKRNDLDGVPIRFSLFRGTYHCQSRLINHQYYALYGMDDKLIGDTPLDQGPQSNIRGSAGDLLLNQLCKNPVNLPGPYAPTMSDAVKAAEDVLAKRR